MKDKSISTVCPRSSTRYTIKKRAKTSWTYNNRYPNSTHVPPLMARPLKGGGKGRAI